jgi:putative transposase
MKIHDYMDNFIKLLCNELTVKNKPKFITLENLNIKGMVTYGRLSKKHNQRILRSQWYHFREILSYMGIKTGCEIRIANRFYKSTQLCNNCGYENNHIRLSDKKIRCKSCHEEYDRDINAAKNLFELSEDEYTVFRLV